MAGIRRTGLLKGADFNYGGRLEPRSRSRGTAYDTSFGSVSLLLPFNGTNNSTTFQDRSNNRLAITASGNAAITTARSRFGDSSAVFDGNNDYLTATSAGLAFETGDFTVEGWIYRLGTGATGANSALTLFDARTAEPSVQPYLFVDGNAASNVITYFVNGSARITGATIALNTWYYFQLIRASGTTRLYLDGAQTGSSYSDSNNYTSQSWTIAGRFAAASGDFRSFNGNLDDWRVTKGFARSAATATSAHPLF